jgi:translation initiation factor IF-2
LAKNLKLTIKNTQIAKAINLSELKDKLADRKASSELPPENPKSKARPAVSKTQKPVTALEKEKEVKEDAPKIRARSRSAFAEPLATEPSAASAEESKPAELPEEPLAFTADSASQRRKTSEELRKEIFKEEIEEQKEHLSSSKNMLLSPAELPSTNTPEASADAGIVQEQLPPDASKRLTGKGLEEPSRTTAAAPALPKTRSTPPKPKYALPETSYAPKEALPPAQKLGPTGKHIKDLLVKKPVVVEEKAAGAVSTPQQKTQEEEEQARKAKAKGKPRTELVESEEAKDKKLKTKFKEFRDIKPIKRQESARFDGRDRQGLRDSEEDQLWRKKRGKQYRLVPEDITVRPTSLNVRIPIALKDLASEMKLKASQLIAKLLSQGVIVTLNDLLEDETTVQLLGQEFGCDIQIDTSEEQRIRITDQTIKDEIQHTDTALLQMRPPVVAFMGHVDHGKTSLIDAIRKSNRAASEAGAITQHIGAFRCKTPVGEIAILDTPGHEAFSAMRIRGADVTDIVVLVIGGDEGIRQQTIEAIQQAKTAKVTIVVAINKCDKPNFNAENVYRQLAEQDLLPEVWGGQTITINCSALTGEGVPQLLEMLALQAEVLELRANPSARARGSVLESEMHKGKGATTTVLVQNGTLKIGDALVFGQYWGRVKTMHNEYNQELTEADPSTPVEITGLSGLPEAGEEFIVVKSEREAREIAEARMLGMKQVNLLQTKKLSMENIMQQASEITKKILNIVIRADVQGSLEALRSALMKIHSEKAALNVIYAGVGEISESDVQLAAASKAVIIGFHSQIESHADPLIKQLGVKIRLHDIIYHAVDDVKELMASLLDKIAQETEKGKVEVKALFQSSQSGTIAGCIVTEGSIHRSSNIRVRRGKEVVWKGTIASLKRLKEDVREVAKGLECGIVLSNFQDMKPGDILEAYEITYISQEL